MGMPQLILHRVSDNYIDFINVVYIFSPILLMTFKLSSHQCDTIAPQSTIPYYIKEVRDNIIYGVLETIGLTLAI
jgi:hypothetical protein